MIDESLEPNDTILAMRQSMMELARPSKFDYDSARYLYGKLKAVGLMTRPLKIEKWARDFRKLAKYVQEDRIKEVLIWYCSGLKDRRVPRIKCALDFRMKFGWFEKLMSKETFK